MKSTEKRENYRDTASAAVDYHARGWSVIRLNGKIPAEPWAQYQHHHMTLEEIEEKPWYDVGNVTGKVSGIAVLDADSREAVEELKRLGHPATPMVKTARGLHLYFRHPGGELPTRIGLGNGLDLKGDGGYVVAPPSKHPSGANYEWIISPDDAGLAELPEWVMEQIRMHGRKAKAEDVGETIANGSRNKTLFSIACTLRRRGLDEASIVAALLGINQTKCETPLPEDEVRKIAHSAARYEPSDPIPLHPELDEEPEANGSASTSFTLDAGSTPSFNCTDLGNAERLVHQHGHDLRYCYPWGKWLVWNGIHWDIDAAGEVERRAVDTVRSIYAEAEAATDSTERRNVAQHAMRSEARSRIEAMMVLARAMPGIPVMPDDLDADSWMLNVQNGTVDLRTSELRPHRREDLLTKLAPVEYDPEAVAPTFQGFMERILPSEPVRQFLQRAVGYAATGVVSEEVLPILHGRGANGKTTLTGAILDVLGDYAIQAAPDLLMHKRDTHPTELTDLFGIRFVVCMENEEGRRLAEALVKQLTGRERIRARRMREDFWEFAPTHTVFLGTNHRPEVRGTDHAIWRRLKLVPFEVTIPEAEQDKRLPEKLRSELPGILTWIVRGCLAYQRDGLGEPTEVRSATGRYRADMDVLAAFLEERCVIDPAASAGSTPLFETYKAWCDENGEKHETQTKFGLRLGERGFTTSRDSKTRRKVWHGIGLHTVNEPPEGGGP